MPTQLSELPLRQRLVQPPHLLENLPFGDMALPSLLGILRPLLREVKAHPEREARQVRVEDRDRDYDHGTDPRLAAIGLPPSSTPSLRHSHRIVPLLRERGVVQSDVGSHTRQERGHHVDGPLLDLLSAPGGVGDEVLEAVRVALRDPTCQGHHALPLSSEEESVKVVLTVLLGLLGTGPDAQEVFEPGEELGQLGDPLTIR